MRALEAQLAAHSEMVAACCRRVAAARDPELKSIWIGFVVQLMHASAETGSVLADLTSAPQSATSNFPARLQLPVLPLLPSPEEDPPPPPQNPKTTSEGFCNGGNGLVILPRSRGRCRANVVREAEGGLSHPAPTVPPLRGGPPPPQAGEDKGPPGVRRRGAVRAKPKGGAPRGNRNARKSGAHTHALRKFHRELAHYRRMLRLELALLRAALPRARTRAFHAIVRPERCYVRTWRSGGPVANRSRDIAGAPGRAAASSAAPAAAAWCAPLRGGVHVGCRTEGQRNHAARAGARHPDHARVHRGQ